MPLHVRAGSYVLDTARASQHHQDICSHYLPLPSQTKTGGSRLFPWDTVPKLQTGKMKTLTGTLQWTQPDPTSVTVLIIQCWHGEQLILTSKQQKCDSEDTGRDVQGSRSRAWTHCPVCSHTLISRLADGCVLSCSVQYFACWLACYSLLPLLEARLTCGGSVENNYSILKWSYKCSTLQHFT